MGPTWVDFGSFWGMPGGIFIDFLLFFYDFVDIDVFDMKPVPGRFGDEIWPKMTPSGIPKRPQIDPKSIPKIDHNLDRFLIDFGSFLV